MNSASVHYLQTNKFHFSITLSLKIGPTVLLTHLKIILLQYFQFSIFSNNRYLNKPYIYFFFFLQSSMLVPISIPCRCSKVVIFYFFNHYQVGPTVLYYSCRLVVRFCLIHEVFVFRLLFNEPMLSFFFFF